MDGTQEFTPWTISSASQASSAKSRRSFPPELVHAVDLERLYWSLNIKGLEPDLVIPVPRARRLGVRFTHRLTNPSNAAALPAANAALGFNAALREIERLRPAPALLPVHPAARRRALALERWFCGEVAPCVLWSLLQPLHGKRAAETKTEKAMTAPIARALDLIAGLVERHAYVLGDTLSYADLTVAAVLAPIARKDGWAWAGRAWTPLSVLAGRSPLSTHRGAAWVRRLYDRHLISPAATAVPKRAWLP
jgi:glutathione S-transferase